MGILSSVHDLIFRSVKLGTEEDKAQPLAASLSRSLGNGDHAIWACSQLLGPDRCSDFPWAMRGRDTARHCQCLVQPSISSGTSSLYRYCTSVHSTSRMSYSNGIDFLHGRGAGLISPQSQCWYILCLSLAVWGVWWCVNFLLRNYSK